MEYVEKNNMNLQISENDGVVIKKGIKSILECNWIKLIITALIMLCAIDGIMIYNFLKILQNI